MRVRTRTECNIRSDAASGPRRLANRCAECIVTPYTSMMIRIDPEDPRPLYRQVADEIKTLIASGELRKGDPLPAVRQVAADLGVNLNTIAAAYRELRREGLVTL